MSFVHLHVHSHYSVLDGMSKVPDLINKAVACGMPAIALTDHGNMFGIKEFIDEVNRLNAKPKKELAECRKELEKASNEEERAKLEIKCAELKAKIDSYIPFKGIVGVEAYCARRTLFDKDKNVKTVHPESKKEYIVDSSGYHLILLAKNKKGYQNLCKLVSQSWIDGYYSRPRIDKNILEKYKEGLIICSACLGGELPQLIMQNKVDEAEKSVRWFKSVFGDDYYIEIQRHKTNKPNGDQNVYERQQQINPILLDLARKTNTKIIASNDVHFVEESHSEAHDRLICLSTGKYLDETDRMHYTKQEWLKTPDEMSAIFSDLPEAISNTLEIADKIEPYSIESDPIMPKFEIPKEFGTEEDYRKKFTDQDLFEEFTCNEKGEVVLSKEDADNKIEKLGGYEKLYRIKLEADYLADLAWKGAAIRYGKDLTEEQRERIIFELHVMKTMGFPGYFLIVCDYIRAAREELGVSVGPGRGSAAGSVVAYCLKITDIDPLKYDLLFERFLNPDRISLPDIDVDFDDDGRGAVLDWVTNKYGKEKVAHIITYGTMATKSSIKDVGRVQRIPLSTVNEVVKLIPDKFGDNLADPKTKNIPKVNVKNCLKYVPELQQLRNGSDEEISSMLEYAEELEGTIRQIGIHACGVIIGAGDLTNFTPLSTVKDKETDQDVLVTEYDGRVIESVGLIKMDFLGLSTLSIIKEALLNIKKSRGIDLNIDAIPIDDPETYKLYSEGKTIGTFQFESAGMQKYLRELKPTTFEDLIAMNALYRPGPMDYIPQFIARKHGREPIVYDIPITERYLKDTYGVTVYQEQVMLLSRLLAGFTRGESDVLRKAMGKKLIAVLNNLKPKFIEGGHKNGYDPNVLEKIWADWEKFASYAFNKSHATCYSWIAYQTAYLKAHYPAEFMAANLTRNKDEITEVTKFMEECKSMGIKVLNPDVNESSLHFISNADGDIRFGLGGIKGVGEGAVEAIVKEREKNGRYKSTFDFFERIDLSACNKKAMESLTLSGAFDSFGDVSREQLMEANSKGETVLEQLMRYATKYQADNVMQGSLFGIEEIKIQRPILPTVQPWSTLERLSKEKSLIGVYLSAHPLDDYGIVINCLCNETMNELDNIDNVIDRHGVNSQIIVAGIVTKVDRRISRANRPYILMTVEDYSGSHEFSLYGKNVEQFSSFAELNRYLMLDIIVQEKGADYNKWKKEPDNTNKLKEYEYKITAINNLADIKKSAIKSLTLELQLENVDAGLISDLSSYLVSNPKDEDPDELITDLMINVRDLASNMVINCKSKQKIKVNMNLWNLLVTMKNNSVLSYFVNK